MGRCGDLRPARERRIARARAEIAFSCEMMRRVELLFHAQQLLRLFFLDAGDGNAGPAAHDVLNVFAADDAGGGVIEVVFVAEGTQVLALLPLLIGVETGLLELVVRDGRIHPVNDELDALLDFGDLLREGGLAQLDAGAGFVDEVDCLVGQEAVGDVAVGVGDRELDGGVGVADRVELLVAVLDAVDDFDGVGFVGRRNLDGLEAALERAVLLDRLAILSRRGCADALNLSAREGRLEDVGGVEGSLSGAGTHERVQLVDEDDGILILHQLFHDGLEALFKLAAVLGSGHDEREVEGEHALVREEAGDFAVGDALSEAFDDGGFADAGFADEHRVVLGAAAEDLDDALEFPVATDEGIKLAVHRGLGKVAAELRQQARLALALLSRRLLLGDAGQLVANLGELEAAFLQDLGGEALFFAEQAQQQMFCTNMFMAKALRFFRGVGQDALALVGEGQVDGRGDLLANGGMRFNLLANRFNRSMRTQKAIR